MNGPQHYRSAERLLQQAESLTSLTTEASDLHLALLQQAQVHATLAYTCATVEASNRHMHPEWEEVMRPSVTFAKAPSPERSDEPKSLTRRVFRPRSDSSETLLALDGLSITHIEPMSEDQYDKDEVDEMFVLTLGSRQVVHAFADEIGTDYTEEEN